MPILDSGVNMAITKGVYVEPNEMASRRTINRFNEHMMGEVREVKLKVPCLRNMAGARFYCSDEGCLWVGWIPVAELEKKS